MAELEFHPEGAPFSGTIGRTLETSSPAWPATPTAPEGAPNVLMIVLDDVGYGQLSAFGGLCETPNLDRLADRGLRYANFQTTALCSPTRGCLLTGRNHHTLGLSAVTDISLGYPAHNGVMGFEHGFISESLVANGVSTFAVGKWHLTPPQDASQAGPFHRWPLGRGFERFYGFLGGDTDQFHPDLVHDNHWVPQPSQPADGYHLNADIADHAIQFLADLHSVFPAKPWFLYFATGAGHAPHQVEREWIDRYRGAFDGGWDEYRRTVFERQQALGLIPEGAVLPERDPDVPAWESLSDDARRMYARQMETYAGFISQTDHHIGRVLDFVESIGELDNTVVMALSDNGASAEGGEHGTRNESLFFNFAPETLEDNLAVYDEWGGEDTFNHYAWGWTWAGDTPFRRWKRETYRGGITDPLIVSWPAGIAARGEVRHQYVHAIDVAATVLDVVGVDPPSHLRGVEQSPLQGVSFASTFGSADADPVRRTQYFEMMGHRSIYHDGWKATCPFPGPSLAEGIERGHPFGTKLTEELLDRLDAEEWELYDLSSDPTETVDVAADFPDRLAELRDLWWTQARELGVLPLASGSLERLLTKRPQPGGHRDVNVFYPDTAPLPFALSPRVNNRSHRISASVDYAPGDEGVLATHGNRHGGYALFVSGDHLHYAYNYMGIERWTASAVTAIPAGARELAVEVEADTSAGRGLGRGAPFNIVLLVDGTPVGGVRIPTTTPTLLSMVGFSCGYAAYDSVEPTEYLAPFRYSGTLRHVTVDVSGELQTDPAAEMVRIMTQQ